MLSHLSFMSVTMWWGSFKSISHQFFFSNWIDFEFCHQPNTNILDDIHCQGEISFSANEKWLNHACMVPCVPWLSCHPYQNECNGMERRFFCCCCCFYIRLQTKTTKIVLNFRTYDAWACAFEIICRLRERETWIKQFLF